MIEELEFELIRDGVVRISRQTSRTILGYIHRMEGGPSQFEGQSARIWLHEFEAINRYLEAERPPRVIEVLSVPDRSVAEPWDDQPTPITDAAELADDHLFQSLYPRKGRKGVESNRMRAVEQELRYAQECLTGLIKNSLPVVALYPTAYEGYKVEFAKSSNYLRAFGPNSQSTTNEVPEET